MEVSALSSIIPPLPSTPPSRLFLSQPSTLKPPPRQHSPLHQLHNLHPFPSFKTNALSFSHSFEDEPDEKYDESLPILSIGTEDEPDETVGLLRPDVSEDGWLPVNHNGCKACGREEIERGCNGEGRVQGGIATFPGLGWWPIKAYRPCPGLVASGGSYKRQGQSMDEVVSGVAKGPKSIRTTDTGPSRNSQAAVSLWGLKSKIVSSTVPRSLIHYTLCGWFKRTFQKFGMSICGNAENSGRRKKERETMNRLKL